MSKRGATAAPSHRRALSAPECRSWLSHHREGRLGYLSGRGPRSVVVSYALSGDQIMVRVPDYNDIVHYAPGAEVTLEVDGPTDSIRETVSVTGTAALAGPQARVGDGALEDVWPDGIQTSVVCVPMTRVQGFELV